MPQLDPWLFWLLVYWFWLYAVFLGWYAKNKPDKMSPLVAFFAFLWIGFTPLIILFFAVKQTKR